MKVFENKKCAIWVHFELGEPWWFELIDLQNKRTLCKDFIKNRARMHKYPHIQDILEKMEKWIQERSKTKKLSFFTTTKF